MALAESERIAQLLTKDAGKIVTAALFAKDYETKKHSERVAKYSREIAIRYGLTEEAEIITIWALLHDVGKIGIPEMILNKPGRLMEMEEEILKRHTLIGEEILKNIKDYPKLASVALSHHERFDG
nr:HD domain-containing protein [Lachnospiraceae bacterium]